MVLPPSCSSLKTLAFAVLRRILVTPEAWGLNIYFQVERHTSVGFLTISLFFPTNTIPSETTRILSNSLTFESSERVPYNFYFTVPCQPWKRPPDGAVPPHLRSSQAYAQQLERRELGSVKFCGDWCPRHQKHILRCVHKRELNVHDASGCDAPQKPHESAGGVDTAACARTADDIVTDS